MVKITDHQTRFSFLLAHKINCMVNLGGNVKFVGISRFPQNLIRLCIELNPVEWELGRCRAPQLCHTFQALSPSAALTKSTEWLKAVCWRYWSNTDKGVLCLWKWEKNTSLLVGLWNVDSFSLKMLCSFKHGFC